MSPLTNRKFHASVKINLGNFPPGDKKIVVPINRHFSGQLRLKFGQMESGFGFAIGGKKKCKLQKWAGQGKMEMWKNGCVGGLWRRCRRSGRLVVF